MNAPRIPPGAAVLVTGAEGFIGKHVVAALAARGHTVLGVSRHSGSPEDAALRCDLEHEPETLRAVVRASQPRAIVHLAALSEDAPQAIASAMRAGAHVLGACSDLPRRPRILLASSSAVYGEGAGNSRLREEQRLRPATLYGVSKIVLEGLGLEGSEAGACVIRARLFNVIGPGQSPSRVVSRLAEQIALIEAGRQAPVLHTKSLSTARDFIDVRDVTEALVVLLGYGAPGEVYNVCTGRAVSVREVLERLIRLSGHPSIQIEAEEDDSVRVQRGDARRLRALGWRTHRTLETSLRDVLAYWRQRVRLDAASC